MSLQNQLPIGEVASRTGLSVSAIRYYEERGLVTVGRNNGGQRRFARSDIRRLSFVMIAQAMGFTIDRIAGSITLAGPQGTNQGRMDNNGGRIQGRSG